METSPHHDRFLKFLNVDTELPRKLTVVVHRDRITETVGLFFQLWSRGHYLKLGLHLSTSRFLGWNHQICIRLFKKPQPQIEVLPSREHEDLLQRFAAEVGTWESPAVYPIAKEAIRNLKNPYYFGQIAYMPESDEVVGLITYALETNEGQMGLPAKENPDRIWISNLVGRRGGGRALVEFVKGVADASQLPIRLHAAIEAEGFYVKMGFSLDQTPGGLEYLYRPKGVNHAS